MIPLERTLLCGTLGTEHAETEQIVTGWVARRRDHGGIIFVDLRDHTGIVQIVIDPQKSQLAQATELRNEFVVGFKGAVRKRAPEAINPNIPTGTVEIHATEIQIFNRAGVLPFQVDDEHTSEELRLTYRYLDLRRTDMQKNLRLRHHMVLAIRQYLAEKDFIEIETPTLSKSTAEGAREFIVPSRTNEGEFFTLPQSPQLYKQLLMASGMDRYFQIARCYRDEDLRANRQPEFTQLDVEMTYASEEKLFALIEGLFARLWQQFFGRSLQAPLKRYRYDVIFPKYGSDKPDMRFDCFIHDISTLFATTELTFLKTALAKGGKVGALHLKNQALSRSDLEFWVSKTIKELGGKGLLYIRFGEDKTPQSPVSKFLAADFFDQAQKLIPDLSVNDTLFIVAGEYESSWSTLGKLRVELGKHFNLIDHTTDSIFWVTDFPLLEWNEDAKRYVTRHHPFTSPQPNSDFSKPGEILARAYDLVCNGEELGGGSIRIHTPELQYKAFELIGMDQTVAEREFGFLLRAQQLGFPPHGGLAFGIDRMAMMFAKTDSIRDVIAFPKTQNMRCLMMNSPSKLDDSKLRDLKLRSIASKE